MYTEARVREFIGWLSADIPELHKVEVPLLADSWERFKQRAELETKAEAVLADEGEQSCSSLCHPEEPCWIGRCDANR